MNIERLDRMRRAMERERLDALVLRLPENVLLLSGYWPMLGASTLVFPRESLAALLFPECFLSETQPAVWEAEVKTFGFGLLGAPDAAECLRSFLSAMPHRAGWKRIGYEGSFRMIAPAWQSSETLLATGQTKALYESAFAGAELVDATDLLQRERRTKTPYEADKLRIAGEISCIGLELFQRIVAPGISGVELVAAVEAEVMAKGTGYRGAQRVRGWAQVATGAAESAVGYRMNEFLTRRDLQSGDVALLELGVVADGYWADRTRVRVAGRPSDEQSKIFETLRSAQEAAIGAIRPGATGAEVDEAARSVIRDAGYERDFPHITGHGLGFGYHESAPILGPGSGDVLEAGMLTSVEPGIYNSRAGGFRIEDDVLVTESGGEVLGACVKALG